MENADTRPNAGPAREQLRDHKARLEHFYEDDIRKAIDGFQAAAAMLAEEEAKTAFRAVE